LTSTNEEFFKFIKNDFYKGTTEECTSDTKVFHEFYKQCYIENRQTPLPSFSFVQDGRFIIHEYVLGKG